MKKLSFAFFCAFLLPYYVWASIIPCVSTTQEVNERVSDVIFIGQVTKVCNVGDEDGRVIITFSVPEYWKGNVGKIATLYVHFNSVEYFREGVEFIIYANMLLAKHWLGNVNQTPKGSNIPERNALIMFLEECSGTKRLYQASEDIASLGKGLVPE